MSSDFWQGSAEGSAEFAPTVDFDNVFGDVINGIVLLPSYILQTLAGGAELFGS